MQKNNPKEMSYVDLISYIEETNRCPGGKRTISKILSKVYFGKKIKILEIGSNTGFTSIEIAKLIDAEIVGIDVNENAVLKSREILAKYDTNIQRKIRFEVGDATNLNFEDKDFDLIITGGANTFIDENLRMKAFEEYKRVLKPEGFIAIANLFYSKKVPRELLIKLESVLEFKVKPWKRAFWLNLFLKSKMELFFYEENEMSSRSESRLDSYVNDIIENSFEGKGFTIEEIHLIRNRWKEIMKIFNENHNYLSFMLVILRNNQIAEQQEFFIEKGSIDIFDILKETQYWD